VSLFAGAATISARLAALALFQETPREIGKRARDERTDEKLVKKWCHVMGEDTGKNLKPET
jgi:hypothetical protein